MKHFRDDQDLVWVFFRGIGLRFPVCFLLFCLPLKHKIYFVLSGFLHHSGVFGCGLLHLRTEFKDDGLESFPVVVTGRHV
jgi:hypothetical protein